MSVSITLNFDEDVREKKEALGKTWLEILFKGIEVFELEKVMAAENKSPEEKAGE